MRPATQPTRHQGFLNYARGKYAKLSGLLCLFMLALFFMSAPPEGQNGGTWFGYAAGGMGLLIILFLTWFGIRKRRYPAGDWRLQAWLSAHVWLGLALVVIATLHSGFEFGYNVHTLAYALMILVIASGLFGVYAYGRYPRLMTENRQQKTQKQWLAELAELDRQAEAAALPLPDSVARKVAQVRATRLGGSFAALMGTPAIVCETAEGLKAISEEAQVAPAEQQAALTNLLVILQRKADLLKRVRQDMQYRFWLEAWLYLHVPLTIALLAALLAHIIAVFFYW